MVLRVCRTRARAWHVRGGVIRGVVHRFRSREVTLGDMTSNIISELGLNAKRVKRNPMGLAWVVVGVLHVPPGTSDPGFTRPD